eukprot:3275398-Rhodomonas_salina.1
MARRPTGVALRISASCSRSLLSTSCPPPPTTPPHTHTHTHTHPATQRGGEGGREGEREEGREGERSVKERESRSTDRMQTWVPERGREVGGEREMQGRRGEGEGGRVRRLPDALTP